MTDTRRPNVLFFLPDQQRWDWLSGREGLDLRTPNIDRLRAMGMTFTRCYTPSPLCAPARACLATGRAYGQSGVWNNSQDLPLAEQTYYQSLRQAGYHVAGVGKFDLHKDLSTGLGWGQNGTRSLEQWGFTEGLDNEGKWDGVSSYERDDLPTGPYLNHLAERNLADAYVSQMHGNPAAHLSVLPQDAYCDTWIAENGLGFLRNFPPGVPWHLVVNFAGPHDPFDVTTAMAESVAERSLPQPIAAESDAAGMGGHEAIRRHYAAMIEHIDTQVGRFLDEVEARGELDNTLIVYSSDHGEMLGDHDHFGKTRWQEGSTHIPLVVAGPGTQAGATSDTLVELHDLAATFVDLCQGPPLARPDAKSLRPVLSGQTRSHREVATSALRKPSGDCWDMVTDGRYKLVHDINGSRRLFDLQTDPAEINDIADTQPDIAARLETHRTAGV